MSSEHEIEPNKSSEELVPEAEARRSFLKNAGKFAAVTPPAITLLLGTSLSSKAIAKSGGGSHNGPWEGPKPHHPKPKPKPKSKPKTPPHKTPPHKGPNRPR